MPDLILGFYLILLACLTLYASYMGVLIVLYLWHRRDPAPPLPGIPEKDLPVVTIQIPLRNEQDVVQRILDAVAALDWPRDRMDIQILDDSDDETRELADQEVRHLRTQDFAVQILCRDHNAGNKAGALTDGMAHARGDYFAIFDADFCPPCDFLRCTVPYLVANEKLAVVQARWGHLNAEYSAMTRAQALFLDAHFIIDQVARHHSGLLSNFNGTAGVWRRAAIESAGGWQTDTVAEDMDLSYRAQLLGWKILYLPDVVAPAELPPLATAFRQQQYRWAKGAVQCARKLAIPILRAENLRWYQKVMALFHLTSYGPQMLFFLLVVLSLPIALYAPHFPPIAAVMGTLSAAFPAFYVLSQVATYRDWLRRVVYYPFLLLLGMGLICSTTIAILDGLFHWGGNFPRTPKFHLDGSHGDWKNSRYLRQIDRSLVGEILLTVYALFALWVSCRANPGAPSLFNLVYLVGVTFIFLEHLRLITVFSRQRGE